MKYFLDILPIIFIMFCIIYSIAVIIYLNILTHKLLLPVNRDILVGDKELKTFEKLRDEYKEKDVINILVLSGGGVRGLVPLKILGYIEEKTGKKIGELFDFFSGASTGAITAACLACADENNGYKYSAKELLKTYFSNSHKIFSSPFYHQFLTLFGLVAPRFLPLGKMSVLDEFFGNNTISELKGNILIPVYNIDENNLEIVKNWKPDNGRGNGNYLIKDLINGASSPPMLFPPTAFTLKSQSFLFIDPAVLLNNPILHVLLYMKLIFPNKKLNLITVGNGGSNSGKYDYRTMFSFGLYGLYQYVFSAPALSSKLSLSFMETYLSDNKDAANEAHKYDNNISYFRINAMPNSYISPTSTSKSNMLKILKFADKMLEENLNKLELIIETISQK